MKGPTRLQSILETGLRDRPDQAAIIVDGKTVSFSELSRRVGCVAAGLVDVGTRQGDRVGLFLPNGIEAVLVTLACYQLGAVAVPLNYRYTADEADEVLERVGASRFVYHGSHAEIAAGLKHRPGEHCLFFVPTSGPSTDDVGLLGEPFSCLCAQDPTGGVTDVDDQAAALILFTSGSTGRPKGVVHSHGSAFAGIEISRQITDVGENDVVLVGKPISHAGGLETQLMPALLAGATTVLEMKPSPERAVALIHEHAVTQYALMASDLLDFIEYLETTGERLPTLENMIASGDAVPHDLHQRFLDLLGWPVMEGCGLTEIGTYYAMNPRYGERRWGSLGLPCPNTHIRIVDEDDNERECGDTGEIVVQTPAATTGYWNDVEQSEALIRDGWLQTGDLARRDDAGYIWFVSRKKLLIVRRGSNMAPAEIEDVLDSHPLVHASVAVGVSDAREGQIPVVWVAPLSADTKPLESELRAFASQKLATYKNPVHDIVVDQLPRMGNGKYDRSSMQRGAESRFGAASAAERPAEPQR